MGVCARAYVSLLSYSLSASLASHTTWDKLDVDHL